MKKLILLPLFLLTCLFPVFAQQVAENNINGYIVKVDYPSQEVALENKAEPIEIGKITINNDTKLGLSSENTIEKGTYNLSLFKSSNDIYLGFSKSEVELLIPMDNMTESVQQQKLIISISEPIPGNGMAILELLWDSISAKLYLTPIQ